jgi:hypothetical protein
MSERSNCGDRVLLLSLQMLGFFGGWLPDSSMKGGFDLLSQRRVEIEGIETRRDGFPKVIPAPRIAGAVLLDAPKVRHGSLTRSAAPAL